MDAADENTLHSLPSVPKVDIRANRAVQGVQDYYPSQVYSSSSMNYRSNDRHLLQLPAELLDNILTYLSPLDLAAVSGTCHALHTRANSNYLWQAIVQDHVPGETITSPYPCNTFRDLWIAHDPRWFLPKYKIWFSGQDFMGKLILVRYDQRRGCIEGYQLLATRTRVEYQHWNDDKEIIIHNFEPQVKLHLDKPALQLRCEGNTSRDWQWHDEAGSDKNAWRRDFGNISVLRPNSSSPPPKPNRFASEVPMITPEYGRNSDGIFSNFMHARPLPEAQAAQAAKTSFPYGDLWPPPAVPARHRVAANNFFRATNRRFSGTVVGQRPRRRAEVSDQSFRIRSWREMRPALAAVLGLTGVTNGGARRMVSDELALLFPPGAGPSASTDGGDNGNNNENGVNDDGQAAEARAANADIISLPFGPHIDEQLTTYSTLDPALYTPTPEAPWRGIWVGDYSGHGCEFLLLNQIITGTEEHDLTREEGLTDEEFEAKKEEARKYRGRLEAIKLTGDANVPRGEPTFVAEDLGPGGFVTVIEEKPFTGCRVVRSKGHVAQSGFNLDKYIESQLIMISHDRLAQYWVDFGHISYFERVDIDRFLKVT
ncbi:hypothetical protein MCOR27_004812 [Pyricularia oryzae]|nr:hypothetical protein MCOR01_005945 [Pyricularia oryzae]KAI6294592.1 hypothetical protein MCOR33_008343 [Pyricularia grisea]KAH9435182.1 hypothetical protein MCOR02_004134 [Pyricularia oryzae]KAI6259903.1 hypothetical protein MCOR19_003728 [Pyricularia oryzae]KAI6280133.1 hypothetical protein MCOR27_004812 [Pyricularia oryzae]